MVPLKRGHWGPNLIGGNRDETSQRMEVDEYFVDSGNTEAEGTSGPPYWIHAGLVNAPLSCLLGNSLLSLKSFDG